MQEKAFKGPAVLALAAAFSTPVSAADAPWRLADALALPDWFSVSGTFRARYETLDSQFRAGRGGGDQILVLRSTLLAEVHQGPLTAAGEFLDARAALDDAGTPMNTTHVNPAELLQGYLQWRDADVLSAGDASDVRAGRVTMDIGSRRLVARNRYRNTINAFTGVDWQWQSAGGRRLRAFFTLPVNRRPSRAAELADNHVEFDEEDGDYRFWGVYLAETASWGDEVELYYFGLDENDADDRPSLDRELSTLGVRIYRKPQRSRFDYQLESVFQFGESRSTVAATDVTDLDHFAHFQHAEIGYSYAAPWQPRVAVQYDYASGDDDPNDGDNGRFDTLFGARRFDFGPTGIYGAFARSNINSPGVRVEAVPGAKVSGFVAYRAFWLASDRDAWTTSGVVDASGDTGRFIGHQVELRASYAFVPGNVELEGGVAHLVSGEFMDDAPNSNGEGDATYLYGHVAVTF